MKNTLDTNTVMMAINESNIIIRAACDFMKYCQDNKIDPFVIDLVLRETIGTMNNIVNEKHNSKK